MRSGQATLRLSGETAPIVLSLLAWSRRLIAVFIGLGIIALSWSIGGREIQGRHVSIDTQPVWPLAVVAASAVIVGLVLGLRRLARNIDRQVRYLGSLDVLTGLSNRAGVMDRLERPQIALLYLDLDKFKSINDGMGHDTGDEVLKTVAQRLKRLLRPTDLAARLGGDEFVVVLEGPDVEERAVATAERIRESLAQPIRAERRDVLTSSSIGAAIKSGQLSTGNELLRAADLALYRAKRQGRNRVVFFNAQMQSNVLHRMDLEKDLWQAMDKGELEMHYLPEVNLQTGAISGVEALVRWRHPDHGLLRPESFIGVAEETGSMREIGLWGLETACKEWHQIRRIAERARPPSVSVNLSAQQLGQPDLVRRIEEIVLATNMDPQCLCLEVAETVLMDAALLQRAHLDVLKKLGIRIVIDDFGTGHAPLNYLRNMSVDAVKIDRSLIGNLEFDDSKLLVVQAIIALAHDMGLEVTAVGIETPGQFSQLFDLGCDYGQGYYLSEPLMAANLRRLISRRKSSAPRRPRKRAA